MDIEYNQEEIAFRQEVQQFLEEGLPESLKNKLDNDLPLFKEDQIIWHKTLGKKGWAGINWPVEYGGTGWNTMQKAIFSDELAKHGLSAPLPFSHSMVAPVIMKFGSEQQKKRFLPEILEGDVWWCQGYSEPGSGSDLASLKTSAVRQGDHYIVNGQKTWTTLGQYADWIFCLVRTDPSVKKQLGISFLLIDMKTPGIEVRPIKLLDGGCEVNEVYFDNVKVPVENRVGEENKGWTYAKYLLTHERTGTAGIAASKQALQKTKEIAAKTPAGGATMMENESFKRKLYQVEIELMALEYTYLRILSEISSGGAPGPESSVLKIRGTEIQQKLTELRTDLASYTGFVFQDPQGYDEGEPLGLGYDGHNMAAQIYFNRRKTTIYGGSNEIQKGIIAKMVLGL